MDNSWLYYEIESLSRQLIEAKALLADEQSAAMHWQAKYEALLEPTIERYVAAPKPFKVFRCNHHPIATSNLFKGRTSCEFGCENDPPKWWNNGFYGQTGELT